MKEVFLRYYSNILLRNSLYPILATAVGAGCGFLFWIFSARLFSPQEVGLAATLVSIVSVLGVFSLIGYDSSTIRFLDHTENKDAVISTGLISIVLSSLLLSGGFLLSIPFILPSLGFISQQVSTASLFMLFTTMTALNIYTDAVFLAYRHTVYTFIVTSVFSVVKIALPFAFIGFGTFGVFSAASVSQIIGFVLSGAILMRTFDYHPHFIFDTQVIARFWKYSAGNYVADFFSFLPLALLPILITNMLGAKQAAYYYVVMMISGFLYIIPASSMRSLFAEGAHDEKSIPKNIRESLKTTALFLIPFILILLVGGKFILNLFGTEYSTSGITFLFITVLASVLVSIFVLYGSLFRLANSISSLLIRNSTYAGGTLLFAYLLMPYGLPGVGVALVIGYLLAITVSHTLYKHTNPSKDMHRFSFQNLPQKINNRLNEVVLWPLKTVLQAKRDYRKARKNPDIISKTMLFYPEAPKSFHTLYKICHFLGWKIITNPNMEADIRIFFEDTTHRKECPILTELHKTHEVLNIHCTDISKEYVDEVFEEVFGYSMSIDPRTHTGVCVRKSDTNAVHDGKVVQCPCEPEEGYVYQKLIETLDDSNRASDLRIHIFRDNIPVVLKRFKNAEDIFDITVDAQFLETDEALSKTEQENVLTFCKKMGLDYGEIDALRSNEDGLLYIVDVNNTPAGPIGSLYQSNTDLHKWFLEVAEAARREF